MISSNCPRLTTSPNHPSAISSVSPRAPDGSIGHFDLLRPLRFDPGAIATTRLEPAANPDASASQTRQIKTRRRETALVSFPDRNRNVPNPPHRPCTPQWAPSQRPECGVPAAALGRHLAPPQCLDAGFFGPRGCRNWNRHVLDAKARWTTCDADVFLGREVARLRSSLAGQPGKALNI